MTADPMPHRCTSCNGFGDGQTIMNGRGNYIEACRRCKGSGRMGSGERSGGDSLDAEQAGEDDARP